MPVTPDKAAPYAPAATIIDVISRYRDRGLPAPVTKEVLARASVPDSLNSRVLQALQVLDLIDETGQPTATFEGIRRAPQAELNQRKVEWLNSAYADALNFVDPATADEVKVRDAFRNYNPVGQQARMVSLFMGLYADAGVGAGTERAPSATRQRTAAPRPAARTVSPRGQMVSKSGAGSHSSSHVPPASTGLPPALAGLLASLPKGDDGWTQQSRDKFVALFGATLDFCIPVVTQADIDNRRAAEE